jgi:hypothetical protein
MPNVHTLVINGDECIGTSLHSKINPNFLNLDEKIQELSGVSVTLINNVTSLSLSSSTQFTSISTDLYELITSYETLTTDVLTISSNVDEISAFTYGSLLTTVEDLADGFDLIQVFALAIPSLTSDIYSNFLPISGGTITGNLSVQGILLSGDVPLHDIFLTSETDNQTLSFDENTKDLTITNGNTVSLSALVDYETSYSENSAKYESVYTTVQDNSATTWNYQGTDVKDLTGKYESVYTTVQDNSATTWNYQGTDLKSLSSNWDSTYTTVQSNSSNWIQTLSFNESTLSISNGNSVSLASLSSNASKAWGKFDTNADIFGTSYNIVSVDILDVGIYRVVYTVPFLNNNYAITTSSSTSGVVTFTQNVETSSADVHCINLQQVYTDAIVSVVVHGE